MIPKALKITCILVIVLLLPLGIIRNITGNSARDITHNTFNAGIDGFCCEIFSLLRSDVPKPDYNVFRKSLTGFLNLKGVNRIDKNILTIIDFTLPSTIERMWIIDLNTMDVVRCSLVAHGRNSGEDFASSFSNSSSSKKSCLGFFITGKSYNGSHGLSLALDGVEPGINDKAREREIVIHAADYVSRDFIRKVGRLGRSHGCPSIPYEDHEKVIGLIEGGSCIFIYYPDDQYQKISNIYSTDCWIEGMYKLMSESKAVTFWSDQCRHY